MADEGESLLADLLTRLTDELRRGGSPDVDAMAARHPELAGELRELWAAAWIAEELARDPEPTLAWDPTPRPSADCDPRSPRFGGCELLEELGRGGMGV